MEEKGGLRWTLSRRQGPETSRPLVAYPPQTAVRVAQNYLTLNTVSPVFGQLEPRPSMLPVSPAGNAFTLALIGYSFWTGARNEPRPYQFGCGKGSSSYSRAVASPEPVGGTGYSRH